MTPLTELRMMYRDALPCVQHDALRAGIEAIELLDWLFTPDDMSEMRINRLLDRWHGEDSFIDWVRAEKGKNATS